MSKTFDIDCELNYQVHAPSTFIFKIEAALTAERDDRQRIAICHPPLAVERYQEKLGTRTLRVNAQSGPLSVRYRATATVQAPSQARSLRETEVAELPLHVLSYLSGSRYVESELLFQEALQWIGTFDRGCLRVERICEWVRQNVRYEIGTSIPYGTTRDVLASRTGVCRDYAHVAIALCRALNIPARFVVGHVLWDTPPADFMRCSRPGWMAVGSCSIRQAWPSRVTSSGSALATMRPTSVSSVFGSATMTRMSPLVFPALGDLRIAA